MNENSFYEYFNQIQSFNKYNNFFNIKSLELHDWLLDMIYADEFPN